MKIMKYRVIHPDYFPTYFKARKEANLFQQQHGGKVQRKIGCEWCDC